LLDPGERHDLFGYWAGRFGIPPATFLPFVPATTSRTIYLVRKDGHLTDVAPLRVQQVGCPFVRHVGGYLKPTTVAAQLFGHLAVRNVVDVEPDSLVILCREGELSYEADITAGYVLLRAAGHMWGCSLFLPPDRLLCRLPKTIRRDMGLYVPGTGAQVPGMGVAGE
jgi:hypothetical protein